MNDKIVKSKKRIRTREERGEPLDDDFFTIDKSNKPLIPDGWKEKQKSNPQGD